MPIVPGAEFDVFISYSWADNSSGWVAQFEAALKERIHVLFGKKPEFWRDQNNLTCDQVFNEEIRQKLGKSATMVLVVSPGYFGSPYCRDERLHFVDSAEGGIQIGNRRKMLAAVKLPHKPDLEKALLTGTLGIRFHTDPPDAVEYSPGEKSFGERIEKLARGVKAVLEEISNSKTPIYVAEPVPPELTEVWTRLRAELEHQGFLVLPENRVDPTFFKPEMLTGDIGRAALTVHLWGPKYSDFAARQLQIAQEAGRPTLIWLSPASDVKPDAYVEESLAAAAARKLRDVPGYRLETAVIEEARKRAAEAAAQPASVDQGPASIYLICDRTDPADASSAAKLADEIQAQEGMKVHLPESDRDPAILDELHQQRLAECDAVLFYWGHAPQQWFYENYGDFMRAQRRERAGSKPYRSAAVVFASGQSDAGMLPTGLLALDLEAGVAGLEPFLAPLRRRAQWGAGQL